MARPATIPDNGVMKIASGLLHILLVATTAAVLVAVGLVVSFGRDGVAGDVADAAIASPAARAEISARITDDLTSAAPLLAEVPGMDLLVWEWVESPSGRNQVRDWVEHGVQAQLGQDVGPLLLHPGDLVKTNNRFIDAGVRVLPPIELQSAPVNGATMPRLAVGFLMVTAVAVGCYIGVRQNAGRATAAVMVGSGGLLAASALFVLPLVAPSFGALPAIAATTAMAPTLPAVLAALSGLAMLRAVLAHTQLVPYRNGAAFAHHEQGSFDLDFVMLD